MGVLSFLRTKRERDIGSDVKDKKGIPIEDRVWGSIVWYARNAKASRIRFQVLEVSALLVSASIPVVGIFANDARAASVLGAVVVVLAGLRALFHWHDNWLRSSMAGSALGAEIRLYEVRAEPYHDERTRDAVLATVYNRIRKSEQAEWSALWAADDRRRGDGAERQKPGHSDAATG